LKKDKALHWRFHIDVATYKKLINSAIETGKGRRREGKKCFG
jgi:hypothetical protein